MKKQEQVMESLTATSTLQACASESAKACKEAAIGSVAIAHYVLRFGDLPLWMQGDPLIQRGYRRQSDSFRACFWSLFYSHNELINVWSHLLPGIFFLGLLLTADYSALLGGVEISVGDRLMIQIYVAGVAGCLFLSAFFHSTNAHSEKIARRFLKLDYLGIVLNISVTNISSTYFGLRGKSHLQFFYIMLSIFCAVEVFQALRKPHVDGPGAACWRAGMLTALGLSGFAPIVHMAVTEGVERGLRHFPLVHITIVCLCYVMGTMFYVTRIPERYWPGRFDLCGASHQIFHTLVVVAQVVFLFGLRSVILCGSGAAAATASPAGTIASTAAAAAANV